jgi:hypothetical protein
MTDEEAGQIVTGIIHSYIGPECAWGHGQRRAWQAAWARRVIGPSYLAQRTPRWRDILPNRQNCGARTPGTQHDAPFRHSPST